MQMKFITTSTTMLKSIQLISGVISNNSVLQVLEDYLFELNGNILSITATDLETMMRVEMDVAEAEGSGAICIPGKLLMDHLKGLAEQPLSFNIDLQELTIETRSNTGKYRLGGTTGEDYPKGPEATEVSTFTIPSTVLIDGIKHTLFCVSTDTLRPAMTGVCFFLEAGRLTFVATDAHRLSKYSHGELDIQLAESFVVPAKSLKQLIKSLPEDEQPISISYTSAHLFLQVGRLSMSARLIDANFPDYNAVIPQNPPYQLVVNRTDMIGALERVSVFTNHTTNQVAMSINGNAIEVTGQDIDFSTEGNESLAGSYNGDKMQIAFNAKLLIEVLRNIGGEDVQFDLSTPTKAAILHHTEPEENIQSMMLLMPLMIGQ